MNVASLRNLLGSRQAKVLFFGGLALLVSVLALATLARAQTTECPSRSTLPCEQVKTGTPVALDFSGNQGGLADANGTATGFTMADPPSASPANYTPANPTATGYDPGKLNVNNGNLTVTTTSGIMFRSATTGGTGDYNEQVNALGVGLDAANKSLRLETTVINPSFKVPGRAEQGGIWFGINDDNYVKLVVANASATTGTSNVARVQLHKEIDGGSSTNAPDKVEEVNFPATGGNTAINTSNVRLSLIVDPAQGKATAYYKVGSGAETLLGSVNAPRKLFDGVVLPDNASGPMSFGGVFATHRSAAGPVNLTFDDFTVSESVPPDTTPPAVPAGLSATAGNGEVVLDWADNAEGDLKGYNVYRSTSTPVATTGTPLNGATPLTGSSFTDATAQNGTIYNYVVRAVDNAGNASAASANAGAMPDVAQATAVELPARVNFQNEAAPVPDGYTKDFGKNYANVRGFGWVEPGTANPRDLSIGGTQNLGNGRDRGESASGLDQRLDTLMHAQADDLPTSFNGTPQEGAWEMALPDGRYEVEVGVGDASPGQDPTSHEINVEGVKAIDDFATVGTGITAPTGADRFESNAVVAEVTDGELTVDAQGGTNTKINYLIVREAPPVDATAPTVESVQPAENAQGVSVGTDVSATFSEDMDAATIDGTSFTLAKGNGASNVPAGVSYDAASRTATLDPDDDLDPASSYTATVTTGAEDAAGNALASAKTWSFETASDTIAPAAPAGLAANAGEERVELSWDAVSDDDLAGYNVYRKSGTGELAKVNDSPVSGTTYADAGLNAGTEYVYAVTAVDGTGNESEMSATQAATPRAVPDTENPSAPGNVRATGGERKIDVAWDAATDNVGVAGYNVYEGQTKLNDAPIAGTSFTHSGLGDDEEHSYVVEAADAAGNTARAAAMAARTLVAVECPDGACADKTVALPFDAGFDGTQKGIHDKDREGTGFRLVQASSNGGKYLPEKLDVVGGQLKITSTSGIQYKTDNNTGPKENALDNGLGVRFDASGKVALMAVDVINPPGGTSGSQQTGLWFGPGEDDYVKLVVASAATNQHKVQMVREINGASVLSDEVNLTVPTGTAFPDWRNSTVHLFLELDSTGKATAFYAVGSGARQRLGELTVPASWSTAASEGGVFATKRNNTEAGEKVYTLDDFSIEELDRTAPAAPKDLDATAGDAKVDLSWTANDENDLAGYNVYRDGQKLNGSGALSAASYADTNLTNDTEYVYTVSAVDGADNESAKSEVRATPKAVDTTAPTVTGKAPANNDVGVALGANVETTFSEAMDEASVEAAGNFTLTKQGGSAVDAVMTYDAAGNEATLDPDADLDPDATYTATLKGGASGVKDKANNPLAGDETWSFATRSAVDTIAPATPANLAAAAGDGTVDLSWDAVSAGDLKGYNVYRDGAAAPLNSNPLTELSFQDTTVTNGTAYSYTVAAVDNVGNESDKSGAVQATPQAATPNDCAPYSTLECSEVAAGLPYALSWDADEGKLADKTGDSNGDGTGFTMVQPSSNGGKYLPEKLDVDTATGKLKITTTKGIQFKTANGTTPATTTTNGNSLDNGLGVGIASAGKATRIETTVLNPSASGNTSEQAGVWFGPDEDNYAKVVVAANGSNSNRIQLLREVGGAATATANLSTTDEINVPTSGGTNLTNATVKLVLVADATRNEVTGYYSTNGGAEQKVGTLTVPAHFFDGSKLDPEITGVSGFGGIFATHRNNTTATGLTYTFDDFKVLEESTADTTAPAVPQNLQATAGDGRVDLSWNANGETDLAGYNVYRGASASVDTGGQPLNGAPLTEPRYTDSSAQNGTTYHYVVQAVDKSSNRSAASTSVSATPRAPDPGTQFSAKINFQNAAAPVPSGYLRDYGQPYGARTAADQGTGLSYGWIDPSNGQPLDLSTGGTAGPGNGRDRNLNSDQRLDTLMHMQADDVVADGQPATFNGVAKEGAWEISVPDGAYEVTVAVGDASVTNLVQDPESHAIRAEGTGAVGGFVPSGEAGTATRHQTSTVTTTVADGKLTIDAQGGTNTKINYVDIRGTGGTVDARPYVNGTIPAAGATNVSRKVDSVVATFLNASNGVNGQTFSSDTVKLVNTTTGVQVPATYGTSGGNDTISLFPRYEQIGRLDANTTYRFEVTDGVEDLDGNKFKPYSMTFTTGSQDTFNPPGVTTGDVGRAGFDEVAQPNVPSKTYTSVTMGPDEKLYAATVTGEIYRFPVAADGMLGTPEVIRTVQNNNNDCNTSTQAANGCTNQRLIMGLTFDPAATAENPILWISHNSYGFRFVKDFNSKITRLSGPNLENYKDIVNNLPRSSKDHLANSIAFKNDKMYITVGATTAMGAYDDAWRGIERPLAAAVLEVDYKDLEGRSAPVDVKTPGKMADGTDTGGTYDPYAAGAPVRVYATGVRNAVDILWHSNGSLYLPTNGSAANGAVPATPTGFADLPQCKNRPDGPYSGPAVPEFDSTKDGRMTITKTQDDYLFRVVRGGFYGNPNPSRCEWVLNGGNPTSATDPGENPQYPVGTLPDRNWRGWAYDFANNKSPNGVVEYQSNNFGGKLKGKMLVARYSGGNDIVALTPNGANGDVSQQNIGVPGLTLDTVTNPLDLTEDTNNGNLYVTAGVNNPPDGTGKIVLLRARDTGESAPADIKVSTDRLITNAVKNTQAAPQSVVVSNVGVSDLRLNGASLSGTDAGQWSIVGAPASYPVTIKAGEQQTFQVRFNPTSAGPKGAFLNFASDDPDTPTARVKLRGLGTNGLGGANEPSLQWILDTFEIPVNVGDPNPADNSLPTDAKLGDEVEGMSKLEPAYTDAPVNIEPLAVFGPQDQQSGTVTKVGRYTPGQGAGGEQLFTVANASYQSLNPSFAGAAGFETTEEFGLYSEWPFFGDRRVSGEDALNTWEAVAANRHKMRFYPLKDANGVVPNAFIVATEEHTSGYDYQDVVYIIRNVRAVSSAGEIEVNAKERVFSGVKGTTSAAQTVEVANRGNKPLDLSGATLSGPDAADFSLATTPSAPMTLQAGEKATFSIRFAPRSTVVGSLEASLRIASNDADEGVTEVGLYGLSANGEQGSNEPTLSNVVKTLGHPVNVGGTGLILGTNPAPIGDEVSGGLFEKAGSGPVGIAPIARYSPDQLIPFGYYTLGTNGEPSRTTVASMDVGHEQELNPPIAGGGASSFEPGSKSFGFFTQGLENRLAYSQDGQNQVISGKSTAHAVRSYPAKDRQGEVIPNTFIVAFEDATNGDYQDYVFRVTNVMPSDGTEPPALETEKFNFQPDQVDANGRAVATGGTPVATPDGYTKDAGAAYDATRGYGWVKPNGTPEDLSLNGRLRTSPADPVLRTLIIMQGKTSAGAVGTATNPVPVAWEREVPNGIYTVKVGVGDTAFFDGTDGVKVEDAQVISNSQRTASQTHLSATADVEVTDGKLTLLTTGTNTKLNFVEITGEDTTPPPPPSETEKVNFQPDAATVPDGYAKDAGLGFDATRGYGWVAPGTNNPVNLSAQTRERNLVNDQRLDTLVIMQPGGGNTGLTAGSWEHALPNGAYEVTLSVGDAGFIDSIHKVNVEGVSAIGNFVPTDANKFASATVTVNVTDGRLTVDAAGGDQTKLNYVDIVPTGDTTPDETDPTVSASVDGTRNDAGAYLKRATLTVEAEDNEGGSGIKGLSYSVNGGGFEPYTAPVDFTEAGQYTIVARATDNAGNEATGEEQTFTVVIPPPGKGEIEVENLDGAPFADRLVFNRIQNPEEGTTVKDRDPVTNAPTSYIPPNTVHDTATLRVKNTGVDVLSVEELRISDTSKFKLVEELPLPAVIKPGEGLDVPVRFVYSSTSTTSSMQTGTLTVVTDDTDEPETKVDLAGFWQSQSEGGKEPNFGQILATYGYETTVPQGGTINTKGKLTAQGDEILSPYWLSADPTKPVSVRQLAAFHTQGSTASFGWTQKNTYNMSTVLTHVGVDGQSFLPRKNDANRTPGLGTFTAPRNSSNALVPFGFRSDPEHSDHAVNTAQGRAQIDYDQGCVAPCGHHFRTWPALDRSGKPIPNAYLMTMDYAGINYDFQDNVYLVTNVKPENPALDPAAPAPLPGAASLKLEFDKDTPNTLADKNNVGTGFRSTQPNKNDIGPGSDSYKKEFLEMGTAAPGTLAVTTNGTTNGGTTNGLVNGLRLPFDGSGGEYTMSTRLVGPLNSLGAGQGGVMFGSDQDNFVKVAAINRGTVPSIEFFAERGGNNSTANGNGTISTAVIPNGGNVGSLDLYLIADKSTGEVRAAYRADDGALTAMAGKVTLTDAQMGRFFAEQAKAGIIAHHGTATNTPATLTFDRFAVTPGAPGPAAGGRNALYRLDTGTASGFTYTDVAGNAWTSDAGFYTPSTAINEGNNTDAIENTEDDVLYRTYRGNVGSVAQAQRVLTYNLPTSGAEKLDLKLHFAERNWSEAGKRLFDIEVEGKKARTNFDIFNAAGGKNTATALTIDDVAVTDGSLTLALRASVDFPAISGIEVLCEGACPDPDETAPAAPAGLAATASDAGIALDWENNRENDVAGYNVYRSNTENGTFTKLNSALVGASQYSDAAAPVGATSFYKVEAVDTSGNVSGPATANAARPQASQAAIRINTGGPAQTVSGVSWRACDLATNCSGFVTGGNKYSENDTITGIPQGMNNTIFQSEWTGGRNSGIPAGGTAFSFNVPVPTGDYRLRLHFAELNKTANGTRVFDVNVEGGAKELTSFDIFKEAGGIDKAIVREIPIRVTDGTMNIDFIAQVENAKISAIEILPTAQQDTEAPAAPKGLSATASEAGIALDWADSAEADLAGYNVSRSTTENGTFAKLNSAPLAASAFNDVDVDSGKTYFYKVTAVDKAANESGAASDSATMPDATGFSTITWTNANQNQPQSNSEGQSEVVGGKLYSFGGFDSKKSCCSPTSRAYSYTPATGWVRIANMPAQNGTPYGGVTHAGFTTDGEDIFWAGGYTSNGAGTGQIFGTKEVWRYDVSGDRYVKMANLPVDRAGGQLEYVNGKLYYFGGTNLARTQDVGNLYVLDLANQSAGWTERAPMPNGRHHLASAVIGGKVYAIGGQQAHDEALVPQADVHAYDPQSNTWTQKAPMPRAINHATSSTVVMGGRVIVVGGQTTHGTGVADVNAYNPTADAWTALTPLPTARHSGVAGVLNGNIYFSTGGTNATLRGVPGADTTAPEVAGVQPSENATGVGLGANVQASFNEAMDNASLTAPGNFALAEVAESGDATPVAATVTTNGNKAILDPDADLEAGKKYAATVKSAVKDSAGNQLGADKTWSFTTAGGEPADTTPPDAPTVRLAAASDSGSSNTDNITNVSRPTFGGTAEANSTVEIFDGNTSLGTTPANGSGDWSFTAPDALADGDHAITAKATDASNNASPASAALQLTIDAAAPDTALAASGPSGTVNSASAEFAFSSENGAAFECKLDAGSYAACTSPKSYTGLANGQHTFSVRATDRAGNTDASAAERTWTVDVDTLPPTVQSVTPQNNAVDIAPGANVTATFSEAMKASTINGTTFNLKKGTTAVAAAVTYDATTRTATLDPAAALDEGATYTAAVTTGAQDAAGNALGSAMTWSFTTRQPADTTPPAAPGIIAPADNSYDTDGGFAVTGTAEANSTVKLFEGTTEVGRTSAGSGGNWSVALTGVAEGRHTYAATATDAANNASPKSANVTVIVDKTAPTVAEVSPANQAQNVAVGTAVGAIFSEDMKASTISGTTFKLVRASDSAAVNAGITYDAASRTATLDPNANLAPGTAYTATVTTGVQDAAGNSMSNARVWSFTTAATADTIPPTVTGKTPANNAPDVAQSSNATATFSEEMTGGTIDTSTFKLAEKVSGAGVAATVTYDNTSKTATLNPNADLKAGTAYTATLTTGVKDSAGNPLAAAESWSFTTASSGPPASKTALLVAGSTSLNASDAAIRQELIGMGYGVTVESQSATKASSANGKSVVLVSSTVSGATVGTKFRNVAVPVITWEMAQLKPEFLSLTAAGNSGRQTGQSQVSIVDSAHPLAGGLTNGNKNVLKSGTTQMTWGTPNNNAAKVATIAGQPNRAAVFGYEAGKQMPGLVAPERRVGLYLHDTTAVNSNANGWSLFRAAVEWADGEAGNPPPEPTPKAVRINAGGAAQTVGSTSWLGCKSLSTCNGYVKGGNPYTKATLPNVTGAVSPANEAIYQAEWTGGQTTGVPKDAVAFSFGVPVASGDYLVRLHFAEVVQKFAGSRQFDVNIEGGAKELTNFDIYAEAGGMNRAIVREFPVSITDGTVNIDFIRQVENAKIDGIEIVPVDATAADTTAPRVKAPEETLVANSTFGTNAVPVELSWSASDEDTGVARYQIQQSTVDGSYVGVKLEEGSDTSAEPLLDPNENYNFRVRAQDRAGNWSDWETGRDFGADAFQESDEAIAYEGAWREQELAAAFGGSVMYATAAQRTATFAFTGDEIAWVAHKAPTRGKAAVYIDGVRADTVDLYAASTKPRQAVFSESLSPGDHEIRVQVLGTKNKASKDERVGVDAFVVLR